jgi:hypothetical protein
MCLKTGEVSKYYTINLGALRKRCSGKGGEKETQSCVPFIKINY